MRIGIVGAGAIGCVVGGLLTKAGQDVVLIDPWPEHVETMKRRLQVRPAPPRAPGQDASTVA